MKSLWTIMLLTATANSAHAERYEWQLGLAPTAVMLRRHGSTDIGGGLQASVSYGIRRGFALETSVGCHFFDGLYNKSAEPADGIRSGVSYNTRSCSLVPAVVATFGRQLVRSASFGLGYRYGRDVDRASVSERGAIGRALESRSRYAVVAEAKLSIGIRFATAWMVSAVAAASRPLVASGNKELVTRFGLMMGFFSYL